MPGLAGLVWEIGRRAKQIAGRVRASSRYGAAVRHAYEKRYSDAERELELAFENLGARFPTYEANVSFNLLMAVIKLRVGDDQLAESGALVSKGIVSGAGTPDALRRYVNIYADRLIRRSRWNRGLGWGGLEDEPAWPEVERIKSRVPAVFKSTFPVGKPADQV